MVHVGYVNIRDALDLTTFLHDEDDHVVWYTIFTDLTKARTMFSNEDLSNFRVNYMFHSLHCEKPCPQYAYLLRFFHCRLTGFQRLSQYLIA